MQRPGPYSINFQGPFLGLNTAQPSHALGAGFAQTARDVLIAKGGTVYPRPPYVDYAKTPQPGQETVSGDVIGMLHLDARTLEAENEGSGFEVIVKAKDSENGTDAALYRYNQLGASGISGLSPDHVALSDLQPTWVMARRWL